MPKKETRAVGFSRLHMNSSDETSAGARKNAGKASDEASRAAMSRRSM